MLIGDPLSGGPIILTNSVSTSRQLSRGKRGQAQLTGCFSQIIRLGKRGQTLMHPQIISI